MMLYRVVSSTFLMVALVAVADPAAAGKDKKVDVVGVITQVSRDGNPKDKDIGHIVVKTPGDKAVKISVMKATDILRNGKMVEFKALDKGDHVSVFTQAKHPHIAEKIVIKKDK